eukprot:CAMPEP_0172717368 /NCGR_PEP_ID=MMETSP1074-20121228/71235_1 /TAXON_ID=2916 /ORGANISM="Ceratium fusus, Strain PA161109" /LENGTH=42 /DNA_ID= /DNA_START= /DNA_END= /DNA_ORIENTATION=
MMEWQLQRSGIVVMAILTAFYQVSANAANDGCVLELVATGSP